MIEIWEHCTQRGLHVLPCDILHHLLAGADAESALRAADLAVEDEGGLRIRGTAGRVEWLKKKREASKKGGEATREKWKATRPGDGPTLDKAKCQAEREGPLVPVTAPAPRKKKTPHKPPKGEVAEATRAFTASFNRFFDRHTRGGNGTQALVRKALKRGYTPEQLKAACWAARSKCDGSPHVLENFEPKSILRLTAREGMSLPDWLEKADELWAEKYPDKPPAWGGADA
jgi:hypothetical protein